VDLEWYGAGKYGYDAAGVTITFNESIFECGEAAGGRRVVCADGGVLPMPAGEVAVLGMVLADEIPQTGGDHSLVYSAVLDSDADPANDWVFVPPFDMDYFQGTDRWYQVLYDHIADSWRLVVTQLSPDGGIGTASEASTVRAVVEGDTVVFFISMEEFPAAEPGYRLTAFGHDGLFSESDRGGDVSGRLPNEPPLPLERGTVPVSPG
jgi:hypothetical protein